MELKRLLHTSYAVSQLFDLSREAVRAKGIRQHVIMQKSVASDVKFDFVS